MTKASHPSGLSWQLPLPPNALKTFDVSKIRLDFPILTQQVKNKPLVYLDNAATSQKPQLVIDALNKYYVATNSNIHRGVHTLSQEATDAYEDARKKIRIFINAKEDREIIFVRSTTEGINLLAQTYGRKNVGKQDEIVISAMEHHSNIVPWQMLCREKGAHLRVIPMNNRGELILDEYEKLLNNRTRLVSVTHVSNVLGTLNPISEIVRLAHCRGIPVHLDGAQAVPHLKIDVGKIKCDFYTFSGHKLFGPTGVGVFYGKADLLEGLPPYQGGGGMVKLVTFEKTTYADIPNRFEAGTPNISGSIGLGAAVEYLNKIGLDEAAIYEENLLSYATQALSEVPGLRLIGTAKSKIGVLSFVLDEVHPHDIGTILDGDGIAVRTGHHCAQPVMRYFEIPATTRASIAFYNTKEEIDILIQGIHKVLEVFH